MKFDFRRLSPALVTSLALIFFALLCASIGWTVLAWLVGLLGLALNVVGIAVIQVDDAPSSTSAASGANRAKVSGNKSAEVGPAGNAESAPAKSSVKSNPFADKAKNARAALRNSASRGARSGEGSTSTKAGGNPSTDAAAAAEEADAPRISKRF